MAFALVVLAALLGVVALYMASPAHQEPRSTAAAVLQQRIFGLALAPAASAPVSAADAPLGHGMDEREVCGVGWFRVDAQGVPLVAAARIVGRIDLPSGRREWVDALRSDRSERAQAVAALLDALGPGASVDLAGHVAEIASRSADPVLYGFALRTCKTSSDESPCRLLSPAQWARLDPGNAAPWIELLSRAGAKIDPTVRDEAMHRIATSDRNDGYYGRLPGVILEHAPTGDRNALIAWLLAVEVIGIEAAWPRNPAAIFATCNAGALADANRRQTCRAVADVMGERSDDSFDEAMGARLGERLGWPIDKVDRLRGEADVYQSTLMQTVQADAGLGCSTIRRDLDLFRSRAAIGEVGTRRRWIAASGRTSDEFVALGRGRRELDAERRARAERAAAASASPASTPGR